MLFSFISISLEQRKEEAKKEIEEYKKNMPDPDQPPGHRKLPEEERINTLNKLKDSKLNFFQHQFHQFLM